MFENVAYNHQASSPGSRASITPEFFELLLLNPIFRVIAVDPPVNP